MKVLIPILFARFLAVMLHVQHQRLNIHFKIPLPVRTIVNYVSTMMTYTLLVITCLIQEYGRMVKLFIIKMPILNKPEKE